MFLVRSPLRISLGGGGTDLPSYYRKKGGYLIAGAINKYVYTAAIKPFNKGIFLKYSEIENVNHINQIKHKIFKEILSMREIEEENLQIELTTLADIPAGTGLGSSGAFTVSTLRAIEVFFSEFSTSENLAKQASHIEIERLKEPIGKQDQYISALGGLSEFTFHKDDTVEYNRLPISEEIFFKLEDSILLFFTGYSRSASSILATQDNQSNESDENMIANLDSVKEMGLISRELLINGDINQYGLLMQDHWNKKLKRSPDMCPPKIKKYFDIGLANGAIGGKLIGAGGGGFIMFIADDKNQLRKVMTENGLKELRFNFDQIGVHVLQH